MGNTCKNFFKEEKDIIIKSEELSQRNHTIIKEIEELKKRILDIPLFQRKSKSMEKYNKKIKERKSTLYNINNNNFIKEYIDIIELLYLNETDKDIVHLYLNFIKENDENIKKFNLDTFDDEIKKYKVIFTCDEINLIKSGIKLKSEKDNLINFLQELKNIKNDIDINNVYIRAENEYKYIKYFNYPIEFYNEELYYYKIYVLLINQIVKVEKEKAFSEKNKKDFIMNKSNIAKLILDNKILENKNITNNEDKMNILLLLILFEKINKEQLSINFNRLMQTEQIPYQKLKQYININSLGEIIKEVEEKGIIIFKSNTGHILELHNDKVCLNNINNDLINMLIYIDEKNKFNTLDNLLLENSITPFISKIKKFLNKIIDSNVYKESIKKMFPKYYIYILEKNLEDIKEYINSRIKFYPFQYYTNSSVTDKLSCNSYISVLYNVNAAKDFYLILKCAAIIYNCLHELNNLNKTILYYIFNDKNFFNKEKKDGEKNIEEILFGKKIRNLKLLESFYILNENNYNQTLDEFRKNFENLNNEFEFSEKLEYFQNDKNEKIFNDFFEIIKNLDEKKYIDIEYYHINIRGQAYTLEDSYIYIPKKFCKIPS